MIRPLMMCAFALLVAHPVAAAAPPCAPRETVTSVLTDRLGETLYSSALSSNGIVETWASEEQGSWTITVTLPDGLTCIVASGEMFEAIAPEPKGDDT